MACVRVLYGFDVLWSFNAGNPEARQPTKKMTTVSLLLPFPRRLADAVRELHTQLIDV